MKKSILPILLGISSQVIGQNALSNDQTIPYTAKLQSVCKAKEIGQHQLVLESSIWLATPLAGIKYGRTPSLEMGERVQPLQNGALALGGLEPATIYYVQPFGITPQGDTLLGQKNVHATASMSSGFIKAYFNATVAPSFANPTLANYLPGEQIVDKIIDRIDSATTSIDVAMYNNSRADIVQALEDAQQRGVVVRYICDVDESNTALTPNPSFPVFRVAPGNARMHNKFYIFDANSVNGSWVIGGSMNLSDDMVNTDKNNVIFLQDQSLAQGYTLEFNEMWGDTGPNYNAANSRVGMFKTDNTPHQYVLAGRTVESYFSPSDNTSQAIVNAINTASDHLLIELLTFTFDDIAVAICNSNATIKGLIDNVNDQGSEYNYLRNTCGLDVRDWTDGGILHHKSAIIDETQPNADPIVITGSHNWSASAQNNNDENTLMVHDATIANHYRQEFEKRWCETLNLANCIATGVEGLDNALAISMAVTPNPMSGEGFVEIYSPTGGQYFLQVFAMDGRAVHMEALGLASGSTKIQLGTNALATGTYFSVLKDENGNVVGRVVFGIL